MILIYWHSLAYCATVIVNKNKNEDSQKVEVAYNPSLLQHINIKAGLSLTNRVVTRNIGFSQYQVKDNKSPLRSIYKSDNKSNQLASIPLFYPSPFRLTEGSNLFIKFNSVSARGAIELRIYDMRGNEIYRAQKECAGLYLRFPFSHEQLGHTQMPAGVYFYLVLHEGSVLTDTNGLISGKGKFAILP